MEHLPAVEIADLIDRLKSHFVLSTAGLPVVLHERREELLRAAGVEPGESIWLGLGKGNGIYFMPVKQVLDAAQTDQDMKVAVMQSWAELAVLKVGQEMKNAKYFDRQPVFEYLRHIRNAVAHGNRFHFEGNNPISRPATFLARSITLPLEGDSCIGGVLKVGEVFLLLDHVAARLRLLH